MIKNFSCCGTFAIGRGPKENPPEKRMTVSALGNRNIRYRRMEGGDLPEFKEETTAGTKEGARTRRRAIASAENKTGGVGTEGAWEPVCWKLQKEQLLWLSALP